MAGRTEELLDGPTIDTFLEYPGRNLRDDSGYKCDNLQCFSIDGVRSL